SRTTEFVVRADAQTFCAPALVVATGGLSIPKIGATAFGYELARQFRLKIRATRPALVPLVLNARDRADYCDLAGVSAEVAVKTEAGTARPNGRETNAPQAKSNKSREQVKIPALHTPKDGAPESPLHDGTTGAIRNDAGRGEPRDRATSGDSEPAEFRGRQEF